MPPNRPTETATLSRSALDEFFARLDPTGSMNSHEIVANDPLLASELERRLAELGKETSPSKTPIGGVPGMDASSDPTTLGAGRYRVLCTLGEGGMGRVVKALDTKLERVVAIKQLHPKNDAAHKAVTRFLREAKAIARLNHRNIVHVYDVAEDTNGHYLVMEFVDGGDLHQLLETCGRISLSRALHITIGLCEALSVAHENGIIHRDVKPRNVLIGPGNVAKLADFGLARSLTTSDQTTTGRIVGTPVYMPPEQFDPDGAPDGRADIYALGMTLYQMVTGLLPPRLREADIPAPVRDTILKATARDPDARYSTAAEMRQALHFIDTNLFEENVASHCPACGEEIRRHDARCAACGSELDLLFVRCDGCGRRSSVDHVTCVNCGQDLRTAVDAALLTLDSVRRTALGDWRTALERLQRANQAGALPKRGIALLQQLLDREKSIELTRSHAQLWIDRDRLREALDAWEELQSRFPDEVEAQLAIHGLRPRVEAQRIATGISGIHVALEQGRLADAARMLHEVAEIAPANVEVKQLGPQLAESRQKRAKQLALQGAAYFRAKDYYAAFTTFDQALEYSDDRQLGAQLRVAIETTKQHERLSKIDTLLDQLDFAAADRELRKDSPSDLTEAHAGQLGARRDRLARLRVRRRLRRTAAIGAGLTGLVLVGVLTLLGPYQQYRANREANLAHHREHDTILAALRAAESASSFEVHQAELRAATSLRDAAHADCHELDDSFARQQERTNVLKRSHDAYLELERKVGAVPMAQRIIEYHLFGAGEHGGTTEGAKSREAAHGLFEVLQSNATTVSGNLTRMDLSGELSDDVARSVKGFLGQTLDAQADLNEVANKLPTESQLGIDSGRMAKKLEQAIKKFSTDHLETRISKIAMLERKAKYEEAYGALADLIKLLPSEWELPGISLAEQADRMRVNQFCAKIQRTFKSARGTDRGTSNDRCPEFCGEYRSLQEGGRLHLVEEGELYLARTLTCCN